MVARLKDVAERAGVSIVTASRVFNGRKTVKPAFQEKVLRAAKEMNYTPNQLAKGLANKRLKVVSVFLAELENPYFGGLASNLAKEFSKHGYELIICDSAVKTVELSRSLATSGSVIVRIDDRSIFEKVAHSHPVVGIGFEEIVKMKMPNIGLDLSEAYAKLCAKAFACGKDRVAILSPVLKAYPNVLSHKFAHVRAALGERGLGLRHEEPFADAESLASFMDAHPGEINCVFCENDIHAARLYGKLVRKGLRIPEDVAIIGCDATMVLDGMWSIAIDTREIAVEAVKLLRDHINGDRAGGTHIIKPEPVYG